jgi:hypothetical protein
MVENPIKLAQEEQKHWDQFYKEYPRQETKEWYDRYHKFRAFRGQPKPTYNELEGRPGYADWDSRVKKWNRYYEIHHRGTFDYKPTITKQAPVNPFKPPTEETKFEENFIVNKPTEEDKENITRWQNREDTRRHEWNMRNNPSYRENYIKANSLTNKGVPTLRLKSRYTSKTAKNYTTASTMRRSMHHSRRRHPHHRRHHRKHHSEAHVMKHMARKSIHSLLKMGHHLQQKTLNHCHRRFRDTILVSTILGGTGEATLTNVPFTSYIALWNGCVNNCMNQDDLTTITNIWTYYECLEIVVSFKAMSTQNMIRTNASTSTNTLTEQIPDTKFEPVIMSNWDRQALASAVGSVPADNDEIVKFPGIKEVKAFGQPVIFKWTKPKYAIGRKYQISSGSNQLTINQTFANLCAGVDTFQRPAYLYLYWLDGPSFFSGNTTAEGGATIVWEFTCDIILRLTDNTKYNT